MTDTASLMDVLSGRSVSHGFGFSIDELPEVSVCHAVALTIKWCKSRGSLTRVRDCRTLHLCVVATVMKSEDRRTH